jgi:hypothetical protein
MMHLCISNYGGESKFMFTKNSSKILKMLYNQEELAKPLIEFVGLVADR